MNLICIKSTMEPKNYSTIISILKKEQGEKIAPYIFKINDAQTLETYLRKEKIRVVSVQFGPGPKDWSFFFETKVGRRISFLKSEIFRILGQKSEYLPTS